MGRIVILGAGESGAGAAVLAKKEGFDVFVSDMSVIKDKYKELLDTHGIEWEEKGHTEDKILNADEIIKSPGIPDNAPIIQKCICRKIYDIKDDLHNGQQREDHDNFADIPYLQKCRIQRGTGRQHRQKPRTAGG